MSEAYFWSLILGAGLVTWLPRIIPFALSKKIDFPEKLMRFLAYLPLCILTALLVQSVLEYHSGAFPTVKWLELLACLPALLIGLKTKNLIKIVLTGMITIALLRLFF
jgi:branched-subunit amino acid transport protein